MSLLSVLLSLFQNSVSVANGQRILWNIVEKSCNLMLLNLYFYLTLSTLFIWTLLYWYFTICSKYHFPFYKDRISPKRFILVYLQGNCYHNVNLKSLFHHRTVRVTIKICKHHFLSMSCDSLTAGIYVIML